MLQFRALVALLALLACCSSPSSSIDAGAIQADGGFDASPAPDGSQDGPPFSGTLTAGNTPLADWTLELDWAGGQFDVVTDTDGAFSTRLPQVDQDYQVRIAPPSGHWGHSSWLLNVGSEGRTDLTYTVAQDSLMSGISNVLGDPAISPEFGVVSLDIRPGNVSIDGLGFDFNTSSDPIFTFGEGGVPIESPTLLGGGDTVLIFANIEPQLLPIASPNLAASGCSQLAPPSELQAKTIVTLVVSCD
ncbi:MAG: hypothetical protein GY811_13785 [Myxococcales bacterium]|nr:hypothetical protein [Myxococcales bacterium]